MSAFALREMAASYAGVTKEKTRQTANAMTVLATSSIEDWRWGKNQWLSLSVFRKGNKLRVLLCQGEADSDKQENKISVSPSQVADAMLGFNDVLVARVTIDGIDQVFTFHAKPLSAETFTNDYLIPQQMNFHREVRLLPTIDLGLTLTRSSTVSSCANLP